MDNNKTEKIIALVKELKVLNDARQEKQPYGGKSWHECELVDDKLFNLLTLLGD